MEEPLAISEARRLFRWTLVIRIAIGVMMVFVTLRAMLATDSGLSLAGNLSQFLNSAPALFVVSQALIPSTLVVVLAFTPWLERVSGRYALAVVLALDVFFMSVQNRPEFFVRVASRSELLGPIGAQLQQLEDSQPVESLFFLLIPLILVAWAYGRRAAFWGSTWATILHLISGLWALQLDLLEQYLLPQLVVQIVLIYVVPFIVSTLARRERRHVAEVELAHAKLRRHAATVEQLAVSRERNRLARDLHDTLAHSLAALAVQLEALRILQVNDPDAAQEAISEAVSLARRGLGESRQAIRAIRADPLISLGLIDAVRGELQALESRAGLSTDLTVAGGEPELTDGESQALFRIVGEALDNAERHADANHVTVHLAFGANRVDMRICDNGGGFDAHTVGNDRYGIIGMRERATMIGAVLEVNSSPAGGTEVWCSLPR